jgi:hypothetical protein
VTFHFHPCSSFLTLVLLRWPASLDDREWLQDHTRSLPQSRVQWRGFWVRTWLTAACEPNPATTRFTRGVFRAGSHTHLFCLWQILQFWPIATETSRLQGLKYLFSGSLQKKFATFCSKISTSSSYGNSFLFLVCWVLILNRFFLIKKWFLETEPHHEAQTGPELMILQPLPLKCWDYRCAAPHPVQFFNQKILPFYW